MVEVNVAVTVGLACERVLCPTRVSRKSVPNECPTGVSHKSVPQQCPARVSHKSVPQQCPTRVSRNSVPQEWVFPLDFWRKSRTTCPFWRLDM